MSLTSAKTAAASAADGASPVSPGDASLRARFADQRPSQGQAGTTSTAAAASAAWARLVLDLQATLLNHRRSSAAASAAVCRLAAALGARRVALGWLHAGPEILLLAASDGQGQEAHADDSLPALAASHAMPDAVLAAMAEAVDQQATVVWPPQPSGAGRGAGDALPRISVAHRALSLSQGCAIWSMPLVWRAEVLGALQIEWRDATPPPGMQPAALENLAAWMAAVLGLMRANERPILRRARDAWRDWWLSSDKPERRRWRMLMPVAAAAAVAVLAWPVTWHVGGPARLEGGVQRVLSAPTDGFIEKVHVRPGERVRAGQPLLDLADKDLQLERQRWSSQLTQQLEAHSAAQARADRPALAQHQSKADEAQAQLDLVEQRLARSRLVAPFDALVVQGDLAQQLGAPVKQGAELITLSPADSWRVIVEVDEHDAVRLALGQSGTLALSALPWDTLNLKVERIAPVAKAVEGRNIFEVEASLSAEAASLLRPGLLGQARIAAGEAGLGWQLLERSVSLVRLWWWRWFP